MTLALAVLDAMVESGCTAAQVVAAVRADEAERIRRRCARAIQRALFPRTVAEMAPVAPAAGPTEVPIVAPVGEHQAEVPTALGTPRIIGSGGLTLARGRKGLGLANGLSGTARQVGAALLEYVNRDTGQCNPSIKTLAQRFGISERSVKRATAALDLAGLIKRQVRRGSGHRTVYLPVWAALADVAADWDVASSLSSPRSGQTANRSRSAAEANAAHWGQKRPGDGARSGPRTLIGNPASLPLVDGARPLSAPRSGEAANRLGDLRRAKRPDPRQREMLMPLSTPRSGEDANRLGGPLPTAAPAAAEATADPAYGAAGVRLWGDLKRNTEGEERQQLFALAIDDRDLLHAATLAEMRGHGDGIAWLRAVAQGPPAKVG